MGRKGVSKRKAPKSKSKTISSEIRKDAVPGIARVSESQTPKIIGKSEGISGSKNSKKK